MMGFILLINSFIFLGHVAFELFLGSSVSEDDKLVVILLRVFQLVLICIYKYYTFMFDLTFLTHFMNFIVLGRSDQGCHRYVKIVDLVLYLWNFWLRRRNKTFSFIVIFLWTLLHVWLFLQSRLYCRIWTFRKLTNWCIRGRRNKITIVHPKLINRDSDV